MGLHFVDQTLDETLYGNFSRGLIDSHPVLLIEHILILHWTSFFSRGGSMRVTFGFLPGLDSIPTSPSSLKTLSPFHFCCLVMPKSDRPLVVRVMMSFPSSIIFSLKTSPTLMGD